MLKYEGQFKAGETVKAYDFQPFPDRPDSYIVGTVVEEKCMEHGFQSYKLTIKEHVFGGKALEDEVGTEAWIPHQVSFMEYEGRIVKVAA